MKKLLNLSLFALIAVLVSSCGLGKMVPTSQVQMQLEETQLENKGGKVEYTIKGTVPPKFMKKKAAIDITVPAFEGQSAVADAQTIRLVGEKSKEKGTVISYKKGGSFTVKGSFDFDETKANQPVNVNSNVSMGKHAYTYAPYELGKGISNLASTVAIRPTLSNEQGAGSSLLYAPHEYEEVLHTQNGVIYFQKDVASINWYLALNKNKEAKATLKEFSDFLVTILEQGKTVKQVVISGWASPEGEESRNQGLSERRFAQGKKWFEQKMNAAVRTYARSQRISIYKVEKPEIVFEENANGEDWSGFDKAVEASNIAEKNQILNVTRSQKTNDGREQKIREMTDIYTEIADVILPPLRRVEVAVIVPKNNFPVSEIVNIVQTAPEQLTVNERLYGASQIKDLAKQQEVYTAITNNKEMENDWRAYNNIAILEMNKFLNNGDANAMNNAKTALDKALATSPNNGIIFNNMGIWNFLQGNIADAKANFEKAQSAFVLPTTQSYHLSIFNILEGNYAEAKSTLGKQNCDYLNALVNTLMKDYTAAKNAIDCVSPKTAEAAYLAAVIAARTSSEQDVYNNLKEAVKLNSNCKEQAKNDVEFAKYSNNDAFKNIVK